MKHYDVIIIGGGPAGLTAAIYALRSGCKTLLIEGGMIGGQSSVSNNIANYPGIENVSGAELAMKMHSQAEKLGLETEYDFVVDVDYDNKVISTQTSQFSATCIILSMGAKPRELQVKNEHEYVGRGVHYCATCDGNFYKNKDVVVVGSGNTAAEDAIYLSKICKHVTILNRSGSFKCQDVFLKNINRLVKSKKVTVLYNTSILEVLADEYVVGVKVNSAGGLKTIKTDAVFVAIGREPDTNLVRGKLELTDAGYIKADERMHTNIDGVFAAGDIREKLLRQIITACADGAIAGTEASIYVNNKRR